MTSRAMGLLQYQYTLITPDDLKINAMFEEIANYLLDFDIIHNTVLVISAVHKLFTEYLSATSTRL